MKTSVSSERLEVFTSLIFETAGIPHSLAEEWSRILVWANLRGVDSHGVMRVPRYVELITKHAINRQPQFELITDAAAVAVIECDRAPGGPAMLKAVHEAVSRAQKYGIGWCTAKNISHAGAIGYFALEATKAGMAAIVMSASGQPLMAYHGSRVSGVSTNPIAIGFPSKKRAPLLLDMSTSNVSFGKLLNARKLEAEVPSDWGVSHTGGETTDPNDIAALRPLGGPKGSGLSLMIECLTSIAVSNPLLAHSLSGDADTDKPILNGAVIAISPEVLGDADQMEVDLQALGKSITELPKAEGIKNIFLPGERGNLIMSQHMRDGISIPTQVVDQLNETAEQLGIAERLASFIS